jgi:hypothetical protein
MSVGDETAKEIMTEENAAARRRDRETSRRECGLWPAHVTPMESGPGIIDRGLHQSFFSCRLMREKLQRKESNSELGDRLRLRTSIETRLTGNKRTFRPTIPFSRIVAHHDIITQKTCCRARAVRLNFNLLHGFGCL